MHRRTVPCDYALRVPVVLLLQPEMLEYNNAIKRQREGEAMKKQYKVHLDEDLKRDADSVLSSMGLSFSTAVGLFLLAVVEEGAIPFQVSAPKARAAQPERKQAEA